MSTYEDRLIALEQTTTSLRTDFLQALVDNNRNLGAMNKVTIQQMQYNSDRDHELTILTGVIASQGKDIKAIKERLDIVDQRLDSIDHRMESEFEKQGKRIEGVEQRMESEFEKQGKRIEGVEQRLVGVDHKLDVVLQQLAKMAPKSA